MYEVLDFFKIGSKTPLIIFSLRRFGPPRSLSHYVKSPHIGNKKRNEKAYSRCVNKVKERILY